MLKTLQSLFADLLRHPMPDFTAETAFADLPKWDSVIHLTLLLTVESHFGIAFSSEEMVSMKTVGEMAEVLQKRGATC